MIFYSCLFFVSVFFAFLSVCDLKQRRTLKQPRLGFFVLSGLTVAIAFGIREGFGTDYYDIYVKGYNEIQAGFASRFELGFVTLCRLLILFGLDYHSMFFITSFLTVFLVYRAIYSQSLGPIWGVYIFLFGGFLFFSSNGIRQALAAAILLNALPFATRGDTIKFFIAVLAASLFHSTALLFIPLVVLRGWRPDSLKSFFTFVCAIVFGGAISSALLSFGIAVSPQIARYASVEHLSNQFLSSGNMDVADLLICSIGLAIFFWVKNVSSITLDRHTIFLFNLLMVGVVVCVLSKYVMLFSRIAVYFTSICIIAIPRLFCSCDRGTCPSILIVKSLYAMFVIIVFIYLYGILNFSHVVPYMCVFSH